MLNMRLAMPAALIDLNDLTEHAYIRDGDTVLSIGALTRHDQIAESRLVQSRCPLLAQAAKTIGHYAIRQRGTIGGSLAHADPAAQFPLVAMTLGAEIEIASPRGLRRLPSSAFFLSVMATALAADEIIPCVHFPTVNVNEGSSFCLFNRRHGDYAIVAAATTVALAGERVAQVRLGLSGVSATPTVCNDMVRPFAGRIATAAWAAEVARAVGAAVSPEDDVRMPAVYRKELTEKLVEQALLQALSRAKG
jgi:carbon-monoxide dehydrogenase medium subunit